MDLEDAVAPDAKEAARQQITAALLEGGYGQRELIVRTNGLDSPWGEDDLKAVAAMSTDAVLLPKVESRDMVLTAIAILDHEGGPRDLPIWCMMETPLAMLHAEEIAFAHERVGCLVMGTSDLAKELHAAHTSARTPFMTSLGICILAAQAAGIRILDGVHLDLADYYGLRTSCVQGLELDMDGKTLIHPNTIAAANGVFAPTADEIAWSYRVIEAHAAAEAGGKGVLLVDGRLVENLHVENAHRIITMANTIAVIEQSVG